MSVSIIKAPGIAIPTFKYLDEIVSILGNTKRAFYPFLSAHGAEAIPYGIGNGGVIGAARDEATALGLEDEFAPVQLPGGIFAYYFDSSTNNHLAFNGDATYSFEGDDPFSLGAWIMPTENLGTARSVISKFESTGNLEEYDFRFDTSGNLILELHDASASQKELATGASDVLVPWTWNFVVATYDGAQAAPEVHLYKNASDTNSSGATVEDGGAGYSEMEDTAAVFKIGCRNTIGAPDQEFEGYMTLPFITGKELAAAEVAETFTLGQHLVGLT